MRNRLILLASLALASCSSSNTEPAPPPPVKSSPPVVTPQPVPTAVRPAGDWPDWPLTAGNWIYRTDDRGSIALFGPTGGNAIVTFRCDKNRGKIFFSRAGAGSNGQFLIRTSSMAKNFPAQNTGADQPYMASEIAPNDPILDAISYSRGRIAVEVSNLQSIAIPNWAEMSRVIEDCRA